MDTRNSSDELLSPLFLQGIPDCCPDEVLEPLFPGRRADTDPAKCLWLRLRNYRGISTGDSFRENEVSGKLHLSNPSECATRNSSLSRREDKRLIALDLRGCPPGILCHAFMVAVK